MMGIPTPTHAIVRPPSSCYADCLREHPRPIDVALAQEQHRGYVRALREAGIAVEVMPELALPDAVFVEDTAVLLGDRSLVTRPGAPSRLGEVDSIAGVLAHYGSVLRMTAPAQLDGGDVLRVRNKLLVGLSRRTNRDGLRQLGAVAATIGLAVVGIEVHRGLHLKSACSLADAQTLLVHEGCFETGELRRLELEPVTVPEPAGANVLAFGDRVLVSAAAPRTADLLAKRGLSPRTIDISELHAGDGALSCLSLRFAASGKWVA